MHTNFGTKRATFNFKRILIVFMLIALSGQLSAQDKPKLFDPLPQELTFKKKNVPIQNARVSENMSTIKFQKVDIHNIVCEMPKP